MSNALVPAGLILLYRHGWSVEGALGIFFVGIGATGYRIYKQKMRVPLVRHDGVYLTYSPSASNPSTIKMDSTAHFAVHELGLTAETTDLPESRFDISRLDFDSNTDWERFISYLKQEPVTLRISTPL